MVGGERRTEENSDVMCARAATTPTNIRCMTGPGLGSGSSLVKPMPLTMMRNGYNVILMMWT